MLDRLAKKSPEANQGFCAGYFFNKHKAITNAVNASMTLVRFFIVNEFILFMKKYFLMHGSGRKPKL